VAAVVTAQGPYARPVVTESDLVLSGGRRLHLYGAACAALLPDRVLGAVCVSALAPLRAPGLDWSAGMAASGAARPRAALRPGGRQAYYGGA
jgi:hypothetical protein